jgi:hypothetical protein
MHPVVHELERRVEERGQWAHIEVRHDQAGPVLLGQPVEDLHHFVEVCAQPLHERRAWLGPQCQRLLVHARGHARQSIGRRHFGVRPSAVERNEVSLGRIDNMRDGVPHLPVPGPGWGFPSLVAVS